MRQCLKAGLEKLNNYFNLTDISPANAAAVILDPSWKWAHFEESWKDDPEWIQDRKEAVKQLWLQDYKGKATTTTTIPTSKPAAKRQKSGFNSYRNRPRQPPEDSVTTDEYEKYLSQSLIEAYEGFDPLSWWLDPLREAEFPSLVRMAWDILSVPGMAASNERVFSRTRDTVMYKRGHLVADHHWLCILVITGVGLKQSLYLLLTGSPIVEEDNNKTS